MKKTLILIIGLIVGLYSIGMRAAETGKPDPDFQLQLNNMDQSMIDALGDESTTEITVTQEVLVHSEIYVGGTWGTAEAGQKRLARSVCRKGKSGYGDCQSRWQSNKRLCSARVDIRPPPYSHGRFSCAVVSSNMNHVGMILNVQGKIETRVYAIFAPDDLSDAEVKKQCYERGGARIKVPVLDQCTSNIGCSCKCKRNGETIRDFYTANKRSCESKCKFENLQGFCE